MRSFVIFIGVSLLISIEAAEMIEQCTCSELDPCIDSTPELMQTCGDKCQKFITELGASYPGVKQCLTAHEDKERLVIKCARDSFGPMCAAGPGQKVERRYQETFQTAAANELNSIMKNSGLVDEAASLTKIGATGFACLRKCGMDAKCSKDLSKCGLLVPPDNAIVATLKTCALKAGFTTPLIREVCHCLVKSGLKQVEPFCDKIVFE